MGEQIVEFFQKLFDTKGFPARWNCGAGWTDFHGWLYIISDLLVWSAYFAIPLIILSYIFKRKEVRFHKAYLLFAGFILSCGSTHLLDAVIFWVPLYRLNAVMLLITGIVSWVTVIYLIKVAPKAFSMKTAEELEAEVENRKLVEEELRLKLFQMNEAQAIAKMGSWEWDVLENKVIWSDEMYKIYGLAKTDEAISYERYISLIHPDDRVYVDTTVKKSFTDKFYTEFYHRIITPEGKTKTLQARGAIVLNDQNEIVKLIGTGQDITDQKKAEQEMYTKTQDLEKANAELQKFAYVASHDLQEPLRKIRTFVSMLENGNPSIQSDEKSLAYIGKINAATLRMQQLMKDILNFSRLSASTMNFEETDLNEVMQVVLADLEIAILTSEAEIVVDPLPTIDAHSSQWRQLFQNLIGNAIKFKKPESRPVIQITAAMLSGKEISEADQIKGSYKFKEWDEKYYWAKEKFVRIEIRDFGIGFDSQYKERIFIAFERLHNLSAYEGTGIGLAICKKIVDYHHGFISAKSDATGTVFTVIVPVSQSNFES